MRDATPKTQRPRAKGEPPARAPGAAADAPAGEGLALKLFTSTAGTSIARAPAGGNGDGDGDGGGASAAAPFGIVVDDGRPVGPGQIARARFVAEMSAEIERVAGEELAPSGRTTRDCPYLAYWIGYYRDRDAGQIERVIERYARPARPDLDGLREAMLSRVRTAVQAWVRSGGREVQAPAGVAPIGGGDGVPPAQAGTGGVQRKEGGDGAPESADAGAVRAELGAGQPLEPGVRERMERGFGRGFGDVRLHTGSGAVRLAGELSARAFALGSDVAFAPGEYRPGSLEGDALLAHELAHVAQQRGAAPAAGRVPVDAPASPAERQADAAAAHVTRSLWSHDAAHGAIALPQTQPLGGLRLQRCNDSPAPAPAPPAPSPRDQMRAEMDTALSDHRIEPAEWQRLNERSRALRIDESELEDLAHAHAGVERNVARYVAVLVYRGGPAFEAVRASYTGTWSDGGETLEPDVVPVLLRAALTDGALDFPELDGLRTLALSGRTSDFGDLRNALRDAHVDQPSIDGIMRVVNVGAGAWRSLADDPLALPIRVAAGAQQGSLAAQGDLRVTYLRAITGSGAWSVFEFPVIRQMLLPLGRAAAKTLLESAGINSPGAADQLARQFTLPENEYRQRMPQDIRFRRDGANFALDTPITPEVPASAVVRTQVLTPAGDAETIPSYTFRTGITAPAIRKPVNIRGRRLTAIMPNREEDFGLQFRGLVTANDGLAPVPPHHLALIQTLVVDPGARPDAAADAGYDGVVTLYYASATGGTEAVRILVHEVGHLVSYRQAAASADFWTRWNQAARDDARAVSLYGTSNQLEDFAESYLMFIVSEAAMQQRFPHRAAILAPLVRPPAAPPPDAGSRAPPPARP